LDGSQILSHSTCTIYARFWNRAKLIFLLTFYALYSYRIYEFEIYPLPPPNELGTVQKFFKLPPPPSGGNFMRGNDCTHFLSMKNYLDPDSGNGVGVRAKKENFSVFASIH
jgi:hypothetical protein